MRSKLNATKVEMLSNQHKRAVPVELKEDHTVTIKQAESSSKLGAKFLGPYGVVRNIRVNRFEVPEPNTSQSRSSQ